MTPLLVNWPQQGSRSINQTTKLVNMHLKDDELRKIKQHFEISVSLYLCTVQVFVFCVPVTFGTLNLPEEATYKGGGNFQQEGGNKGGNFLGGGGKLYASSLNFSFFSLVPEIKLNYSINKSFLLTFSVTHNLDVDIFIVPDLAERQ